MSRNSVGRALPRSGRSTAAGLPSAGSAEVGPALSAKDSRDPLVSVAIRAALGDALLVSLAVALSASVQIGRGALPATSGTALAAVGVVSGWLVVVLLRGGYEPQRLGTESEEFKRVLTASIAVLGLAAALDYLTPLSPPLALVLPAVVLGLALLLIGRWLLRIWLGRKRVAGGYQQSTLIIGDSVRSAELVQAFAEDAVAGFRATGVVEPPAYGGDPGTVQVWLDGVMELIASTGVHAVAVAESAAVDTNLVQRLAWRLEGPGIDLLVSPALSDVAGPRVVSRPAAGLPLLHLDEPSLTGPKRFAKRALDLAIAIPALILLTPVYLIIGLAIRWDSPGPVLYLGRRVGRSGQVFACVKFRSMYHGAHQARAEVLGIPDDGVAERHRQDPRITRAGRVARRWSLDELPQLLNVVGGSMSLVGPRPLLPEELDLLGDADHRRHLTKPGMTGLWQISGRKEVSWDSRMRLDLHYIENWSLALDFIILAKTVKAVLSGRGAY